MNCHYVTRALFFSCCFFFLMIRRPPRSTRMTHSFPTRRSSDLIRRFGAELLIVAEVPGRGWLVQHAPWPRGGDSSIIWRLIGQTLILYVIVLIPVLWVGRRISRPLRSLAVAARDFAPGDGDTPLEARGPGDVRDVIAAFNALRLRVNAMLDEKDRMLGAIARKSTRLTSSH